MAGSDQLPTTQRTVYSDGPRRSGPRAACLVVIHGEGLGRRVDLGGQPVLIGRSDEADLVISHRSVSRSRISLKWRRLYSSVSASWVASW